MVTLTFGTFTVTTSSPDEFLQECGLAEGNSFQLGREHGFEDAPGFQQEGCWNPRYPNDLQYMKGYEYSWDTAYLSEDLD